MTEQGELAILVVAAGRGSRAGAGIPKQYRRLAGKPLLAHTLSTLLKSAPAALAIVAIHPHDLKLYRQALDYLDESARARMLSPVNGGDTRQDSVRLGLEAL